MMLRVTDIHRHYHHGSLGRRARNRVDEDLANPDQMPPPRPKFARPINHWNHLPRNRFEAEWVAAHFDILFSHSHIKSRMDRMQVNKGRTFKDQMVVVDIHHCIVWNFFVTLEVEKLPNARDRKLRFQARPFIAVHRLELRPSKEQIHQLPVDDGHDENIDDIQARMRNMRV